MALCFNNLQCCTIKYYLLNFTIHCLSSTNQYFFVLAMEYINQVWLPHHQLQVQGFKTSQSEAFFLHLIVTVSLRPAYLHTPSFRTVICFTVLTRASPGILITDSIYLPFLQLQYSASTLYRLRISNHFYYTMGISNIPLQIKNLFFA